MPVARSTTIRKPPVSVAQMSAARGFTCFIGSCHIRTREGGVGGEAADGRPRARGGGGGGGGRAVGGEGQMQQVEEAGGGQMQQVEGIRTSPASTRQ
eukprot:3806658-Prymnesium_polylepis.1